MCRRYHADAAYSTQAHLISETPNMLIPTLETVRSLFEADRSGEVKFTGTQLDLAWWD
jgi:hypothetical protein